jgi:hypothetical protein
VKKLTLEEARDLLTGCERWMLTDIDIGVQQGGWKKDGKDVAHAYYSSGPSGLSIVEVNSAYSEAQGVTFDFQGDEARQLRELGTLKDKG